jgi:sigma-B regulation protein RsbU (phosphoserine phosphatase)
MKFRWKLMILLAVAAVLPVAAMRSLGVRITRHIGEQMITQSSGTLAGQTAQHLGLLAEGYAEMLAQSRLRHELALMFQVKEIEQILAAPDCASGRFESSSAEMWAPGPASGVPEGGGAAAAASLQVFRPAPEAAPGASRAGGEDSLRIQRLLRLGSFFRSVAGTLGKPSLWSAVVFRDGLWSLYPSRYAPPAGFDPRAQPWYGESEQAAAFWSRQFTDPLSGESAIAISAPISAPDGTPAGRTAIAISIDRLFDHPLLVKHTPAGTRLIIGHLDIRPETGRRALRVVARRDPSAPVPSAWETPAAEEWLAADDAEQLEALLADLAAGVGGARRMPTGGCDCFWVYRSMHRDVFLILIMPSGAILAPIEKAEADHRRQLDELMALTRNGIFVILTLAVLFAFLFARSVTRPLHILAEGTRRLAEGDFHARVDIRSRDEFGEMGRVFNLVGPRLEENLQIRRSLILAREVQQSLLPKAALAVPGLDIAGRSRYSDETGGDYFDYFRIAAAGGDARTAVAVADVSGHGLSSALLMTSVRALLRFRAQLPGGPTAVVADVNREVTADSADSGQFVTLFYAEIDPAAGALRWVRAGHEPAMCFNPQTGEFQELSGRGVALGVSSASEFEEVFRPLTPGEILAIGTDGIWEARDRQGAMFGKERFREVVRAHAAGSAADILAAVFEALEAFGRGAGRAEDDITLVVVKVA